MPTRGKTDTSKRPSKAPPREQPAPPPGGIGAYQGTFNFMDWLNNTLGGGYKGGSLYVPPGSGGAAGAAYQQYKNQAPPNLPPPSTPMTGVNAYFPGLNQRAAGGLGLWQPNFNWQVPTGGAQFIPATQQPPPGGGAAVGGGGQGYYGAASDFIAGLGQAGQRAGWYDPYSGRYLGPGGTGWGAWGGPQGSDSGEAVYYSENYARGGVGQGGGPGMRRGRGSVTNVTYTGAGVHQGQSTGGQMMASARKRKPGRGINVQYDIQGYTPPVSTAIGSGTIPSWQAGLANLNL